MPLTKLSNDQGHLKAGFFGYAKSGKTYTATKLAIGVKQFLNLPGPVAFFDTEGGSGYVAEMVKDETGQDLLGVRARSFKDLMQFARDCEQAKVSVAIIDSLTHVWNEVMDSYLVQLNEKRKERNFPPLMKLEFSHWAAVKKLWSEWPDWFLNCPLSVIVCGRAAAIWEFEKNEETGKKELTKAGTRMKAESEFSFESALLVEMERESVPDGHGGTKLVHVATVLGDRFGVLDGQSVTNPTAEFFMPHLKRLKPGSHATVDVTSKTATGADMEGSTGFERERKARTVYAEEIQGAIISKFPGQSAEEKKQKADLLQLIFGTRSWTKVESMDSEHLRDGLQRLRKHLGIDQGELSIDETDDLEMGSKTPQTSVPVVQPPPDSQNAPTANLVSALPTLVRLREKLQGKLTEAQLVELMFKLGSIGESIKTLDQMAVVKPSLLEVVEANLDTYIAAAPDWLKEVK